MWRDLGLEREMGGRFAVQAHLDSAVEPVGVAVEVDALVEIEVKVEVEVILRGAVDLEVRPRRPPDPRLRERAVPLERGAEMVRVLEVPVVRGQDEVLLVARAVRVAVAVLLRDGGGARTGLRAVTHGLGLGERPPPHGLDDLQDLALLVGVGLLVDPVAGIWEKKSLKLKN